MLAEKFVGPMPLHHRQRRSQRLQTCNALLRQAGLLLPEALEVEEQSDGEDEAEGEVEGEPLVEDTVRVRSCGSAGHAAVQRHQRATHAHLLCGCMHVSLLLAAASCCEEPV